MSEKKLSRRQFVGSAAAGGLGVALSSGVTGTASASTRAAPAKPSAAAGDRRHGARHMNVRKVGFSDMGGRPDGGDMLAGQKIGDRYYLYEGHLWHRGISILDVTDPTDIRVTAYIPPETGNTWHINVIAAGGLLVAASERVIPGWGGDPSQPTDAGVKIYDVRDAENPRLLSFFQTTGDGTHANWYAGGRYLYLAAEMAGYEGNIFMIVDVSDPTSPFEVSRWWLEGQWVAGGETPWKDPGEPYGPSVHGVRVAGDFAYLSYTGAGLIILDISDKAHPKFVSRTDWSPPYGGFEHSTLPLPERGLAVVDDEAIAFNCQEPKKLIWNLDIRVPTRPVTISTMPAPTPPPGEVDFCEKGGRFGPHNLHLNNPVPGSFINDRLVFATYFNAGLRIYDITEPLQPKEVGYYIPPDPRVIIDPRPNAPTVIETNCIFVDDRGFIYIDDYNAGLYVLEFTRMQEYLTTKSPSTSAN